MKAEAMATSSSKPSVGATSAPVMEAPVTETLGAETPVVETPAAPSDTPAPMETGEVGDSLRDFGGLTALPRPSPGVTPDSKHEQPCLSGGC